MEERPWADGKHPLTRPAYAWFLANWAKRVLEEEVAEDSSGYAVFVAVGMAVAYGRERVDRSGIQSLGIDWIAWGWGHRPLILDWCRAKGQLSSDVVEGFNGKAKLTTRKAPVSGPTMG